LSNVYNKAKNCKPYTANYTPYCKSDIYGDSRNIDPATGNGQMESNTKTSVDGLGRLAYYLSPN